MMARMLQTASFLLGRNLRSKSAIKNREMIAIGLARLEVNVDFLKGTMSHLGKNPDRKS